MVQWGAMQRKEYAKKRAVRDASKLKVGLVVSRFNEDITSAMEQGARDTLKAWKVKERNIFAAHTYGSFELPLAALRLIEKYKLHALIAIGCIIKGETRHDEYLAHATTEGLMRVSLDRGVPVGFGVITTNNLAQARARSRGKANKGAEATIAALEVALL